MAEYQEVIKQLHRICERYRVDVCCANCPLKDVRKVYHCWRWISEEPEKAEELIMKWAKENPVKKNYHKFEETFGINPILMDWWNTKGADWLMEEYKEPKNE